MHSSRMRTTRSSSRRGGGSASVHAGIHPPGCGPGDTPLGVGLETHPPGVCLENPPRPDPSTSPLGVGLETPLDRPLNIPPGCGPGNLQGMLGYHPPTPGDLLQCMLGYHLQCMLGYHPPSLWTESQTRVKT